MRGRNFALWAALLATVARGNLPAASITWLTNGTTDWNTATNWSGGTVPAGGDTVSIGAGGNQPVVSNPAFALNLSLAGGSSVGVAAGQSLQIGAAGQTGSIANAGAINIGTNASLFLAGNTVNLSGTGTINTTSQIASLTSGMTINNSSTIQGSGILGGAGTQIFVLNNSGTISANIAGATMRIADSIVPWTNTGTIQAANGGTFDLSAVIDNTGGLIKADGIGSTVILDGAVTGGTISAVNGGVVQAPLGGSPGLLAGTITLNGALTIGAGGLGLYSANGLTINGPGTVNLLTPTSYFLNNQFNTAPLVTNNVTVQGQGKFFGGSAGFAAQLVNTGLINSIVNGGTLTLLDGGFPITNAGTLAATNGATLEVPISEIFNAGGTIKADGAGSVTNLSYTSGTIVHNGTLQGTNGGVINLVYGGTLTGNVTLNGTVNAAVAAGSTLTLMADSVITNIGTLNLGGNTITLSGQGTKTVTLNGPGSLNMGAGAQIMAANAMTLINNSTVQGQGNIGGTTGALMLVANNGAILANAGAPLVFSNLASVNNNGTLLVALGSSMELQGGLLNLQNNTLTGGTYILAGMLQIDNGADILTNAATIIFTDAHGFISDQGGNKNLLGNLNLNEGTIVLSGGASVGSAGFHNVGTVDVEQNTIMGGFYIQDAGLTVDNGGIGHALVNGGVFQGIGEVGLLENAGGTVKPGNSPGTLTTLEYVQTAGTLQMEIASLSSYDQLIASMSADIRGGTLEILLEGYTGNLGDVFTLIESPDVLNLQFDNLLFPALANGLFFQLSQGANHHNVFLTVMEGTSSGSPAPEPSTIILLTCGLALIGACRLRRQR